MALNSKKPGKRIVKKAKTGQFVLGHDRFAKISAVEGMTVTPEMKKRLKEFEAEGLTAAQKRAAILKVYRKKA